MKRIVLLFLLAISLTACLNISPESRRLALTRIASDAGWQPLILKTAVFNLAAFVPRNLQQTRLLTVYIEGDGLAWVKKYRPSLDPTPKDPLALRLAIKDSINDAVYLARPCQYVADRDRRACDNKYWTGQRFAPAVIAASNEAIDQLKIKYHAQTIKLVGYSGGGAVAALLAARRNDVEQLITIAGNMDHVSWTGLHQVTPLTGSLNPVDEWRTLMGIPQIHFVGGDDEIIPEAVVRAYQDRFPLSSKPQVRVIKGFDHHCCWAKRWPQLIK